MGLAMSASMLISGPLFRAFGGSAYLAMTVLCGAGTLIALLLVRRWQPGDGQVGGSA